jgi:predicted GNAT family acetyltransferase
VNRTELKYEPGRIYSADQTGKIIAEVTFPRSRAGVVTINHTFVDPVLRGRGAAAKLMEATAEALRSSGKKAELTCSYAIQWFAQHKEFADVLAANDKKM